ncbi:VOC family protein [Stutzerimonas nitrititolerans]|uniref:VOC family protein n=1 Tax=Stutzerimonas nitrititolerans TaxID=2482751 RepID=UPI002899443C|nr:VOC family protein [Stutzerimonas nitrititolerans]
MTELLVNVDVPDLLAAERFYCAAFLLKPGRRFGDDAVELIGASSKIYLLAKNAGTDAAAMATSKRSYERHWTPVYFDFVVDNLEEAVARSIAAGGAQEQPTRQNSWGNIAVMSDPFGHGYCLVEFSAAGYNAIATSSEA